MELFQYKNSAGEPSQPSQTTGLTIIITGPGYHLSPGLNYCEYQDTMTDNDLH